MNVHCFYHRADLDGHCSGAIVRRWCEMNGHTFVPHGVNYGDKAIEWTSAGDMDEHPNAAIICDFTPEGDAIDILMRMKDAYDMLVWIDHHQTALDKVGAVESEVLGRREIGTATCVLTWEYLFPGTLCPTPVKYLGAYDVFDRTDKQQWEEITLPLQYGLKMHRTNPDGTDEKDLWKELLEDIAYKFADLVLAGETCLLFERENNRKTANSSAYDCAVAGLLCCGMIAKAYGGGGHKGAAGFELPEHVSLFEPLRLFEPLKATNGTDGADEKKGDKGELKRG